MSVKEEERALVSSSEVRRLEKVLNKIEIEEQRLIDEFDFNAERILGVELIVKLSVENPSSFSETREIPGKGLARHTGLLTNLHSSMIKDPDLRKEYEDRLKSWFKGKTEEHKELMQLSGKFLKNQLEEVFALASLGITAFHQRSNMRLYDVQKLAGVSIAMENIVEVKTGEGKTLAGVLPTFLYALTGEGSHVITANPYLSKRDYNELKPIYEGLGLTCGYVMDSESDLAESKGIDLSKMNPFEQEKTRVKLRKELKEVKRVAYDSDVTFGSKAAFAFDYLRDTIARNDEDFVQRPTNPGFAYVDEVDDALIDDAENPYVLADNIPVYTMNMTAAGLARVLGRSFKDLHERGQMIGLNLNPHGKLDYPEARSLALTLYSEELLPNQRSYQDRAQKFYESFVKDKVFIIKDGILGYSSKDLYDLLTDDDKLAKDPNPQIQAELREQIRRIKEEASVIYYPDQKEFIVNDEVHKAFLISSYFAFQINSVVRLNEASIINDPSYEEGPGKDYNFNNGVLTLTAKGSKRIVEDPNHPEFFNDYNRYLQLIDNFPLNATHYFNQAIKANLMVSSPEDYIVHNGAVKTVKNGRIQEDSTYTDGLHQAIEFKEKIDPTFYREETKSAASVTQKAFYSRYKSFSGATGSSSPDVFSTIYNKSTVKIPRNAFYGYYSDRAKKKAKALNLPMMHEPIGVYSKPTHFTLEKSDKAKAIVASIMESCRMDPQQPTLLVVSDPTELEYLSEVLKSNGIVFSTIDATTSKEAEARIIARAGLPGKVTLSTEKAGRGTDIKLGGDRETLIDLVTESYKKKEEAKVKGKVDKREENSYLANIRELIDRELTLAGPARGVYSKEAEKEMRDSLWKIGLKVISSGYFNVDRIDRQLEGRTGRNGQSGTCERYVSKEDLEFIGVNTLVDGRPIINYLESLGQDSTGKLNVDDKTRILIEKKVKSSQRENEERISAIIKNAQEVSQITNNAVERIREQRRDIIFSNVDYDLEMYRSIEDGIDAILISYVDTDRLSKSSVIEEIRDSNLNLDIEAFALEIKETFGITLNVAAIMETDVNLLELRNAVLETVQGLYDRRKAEDPIKLDAKVRKGLLDSKDFLISYLPSISSEAITEKSMLILGGKGEEADYGSLIRFDKVYRLSVLESAKMASQEVLGVPLTIEEKSRLEEIRQQRFETRYEIVDGEVRHERQGEELSAKAVDKFKSIVEKQSKYSNLRIRPLILIETAGQNYVLTKNGLSAEKNNSISFATSTVGQPEAAPGRGQR